jgi:hypothetical protein
MPTLEQSISRINTKVLRKLIEPLRSINYYPSFTRKVADELRKRGFKVSLQHGTVEKKEINPTLKW